MTPANEDSALLLVDDNPDSLAFLGHLIETTLNWRVLRARDAEEALVFIRGRSIDAALIDFALPTSNGVEVGLELLRLQPTAHVVIMSGEKNNEVTAEKKGLNFIQKPFLTPEILKLFGKAGRRSIRKCSSVFVSYSHRDEWFRSELQKHLALLQRGGFIDSWHDGKISPGEVFDQAIAAALEKADLILLLVSSDFMASEFCYGIELKRAMERHTAGLAAVVPIIIRSVDWRDSPLGSLLALPTDGKPVARWTRRDDAFLSIVDGLKRTIVKLYQDRLDRSISGVPRV